MRALWSQPARPPEAIATISLIFHTNANLVLPNRIRLMCIHMFLSTIAYSCANFAHIVVENSQVNAKTKNVEKGNRTQFTFRQISKKLMLLKCYASELKLCNIKFQNVGTFPQSRLEFWTFCVKVSC